MQTIANITSLKRCCYFFFMIACNLYIDAESREHEASFDIINATIISSNFWPPIQVWVLNNCIYLLCSCILNHEMELQDEDVKIPEPVEQLLSDYAKRFHEIKTPRKLLWKKNLGTVKVSHIF